MPWYKDRDKTTYVATYKDERTMRKEVDEAAQFGWAPQSTAGVGGHINLGRTVTGAALTGGLSLLLGGSRSKDKLTITFLRNTQWVQTDDALRAANEAYASAKDWRSKSAKADEGTSHAALAFAKAMEEPNAKDDDKERAEKRRLKALKEVIDERAGAYKTRESMIQSLESLGHALTSKLVAPSPEARELASGLDPERHTFEVQGERLGRERELQYKQQSVVDAAKRSDEAHERTEKAQQNLGKSQRRISELSQEIAASTERDREKLAKKLSEAEEERGKWSGELTMWSEQLQARTRELQSLSTERDSMFASLAQAGSLLAPASGEPPPPETQNEPAPISPTGADIGEEAQPVQGGNEIMSQIQKLAELHAAGILTDDEFTTKKSDLLSRL